MQKNDLTFSVVIPAYNSAKLINNAINSCLQQTLLPKEIIIIDDCSIDNTVEIIKQVKSPLIKLLLNSTNKGPSYSRNIGIKNSNSSWILFLDADDIFHEKKIEILNQLILGDISISAIGHNTRVGLTLSQLNENYISKSPDFKKFSTFMLLLKNRIVTPALAISSDNGIFFNEKMIYAEDHDFILRTATNFNLVYFDLPLCSISRLPLSSGGLSSNFKKMRIGEINMYLDFCKKNRLIYLAPFLLIFSILKHIKFLLFFYLTKRFTN